MMKKLSVVFLLSVFVILPCKIFGDGLIFVDYLALGNIGPMRLNVKYHHVNVEVKNQVATTKVDQVFENPHPYDLEGTYIFPVPKQADIYNFSVQINKKPLTTEIVDEKEARERYEDMARRYKDSALLEYVGRGMFQARIYSIPAKGQLRLTLEYSERLKADNGTVKYYYTLNTEKFSAKNLDSVSIKMNIQSPQVISNIYSPTHKINVQTETETDTTVTYEEENVLPDRDFILYYTLPEDNFGFNVLTYKDGQEDGFFMAVMSPNSDKSQPIVAKNILFVLDVSGSMYGEKIHQAKEAVKFCLNHLNPNDNFNIITFNSEIMMYKNELVEVNKNNIKKALAYVDNLQAYGCTDINGVLKEALAQLPVSNTPNMLIFLTDGEPTVGVTDIKSIIKNVKGFNSTKTRLFSFGVGYDVNTTLLDKIALDNKGASDYIEPDENIETRIVQFYTKVASPILTDLILSFSGTKVKEVYPIVLPDIFKGSQLFVIGRYIDGGKVELDLSGKQDAIEKHHLFSTDFAVQNTENDFLPRIWAGRKIAHLVDQIMLEGESKDLVNEIIELSKRYGIITRYTSFLIDADAQQFVSNHFSDKMMDQTFKLMSYDAMDQTGKASVKRAKLQDSLRSTILSGDNEAMVVGVSQRELRKIRNVRARTFYHKDNIWIDSNHTDESPVVEIKSFSKEYFNLLQTSPDLGACMALGNKVIIKMEDYSIFINE